MSLPPALPPVGRRTALGAAVWSVPVVSLAVAAPAHAAASGVEALERVDPLSPSFSVGTGQRVVRVKLVNGTTGIPNAVVSFALTDTSWLRFTGNATSATGVTDSSGLTSATLVRVSGSTPVLGATTTLTATYGSLSLAWTITYAQVDALGAGLGSHAFAISGGRLYAWGFNAQGQIGDGSTTNRTAPVAVVRTGTSFEGRSVTAARAGEQHSLALTSDGRVHAWGDNTVGQLGDDSANPAGIRFATEVVTAGTPMSGKTITAIAAGSYHSLALDSDGKVYAWGLNDYGQLGDGSTDTSDVPVAVSATGPTTSLAGKVVVAIAAGSSHSLALASDGTLHAWGNGESGQIGNGDGVTAYTPSFVDQSGSLAGLTVTAIAAGVFHSVALASGTVHAWGEATDGQVGNPAAFPATFTPIAVETATSSLAGRTVTGIAAGGFHTLAVDSTGDVHAWGADGEGQQGNGGGTGVQTVPGLVATASTPMSGVPIAGVAGGLYTSYALSSSQLGFAWGNNGGGALGTGQGAAKTQVPGQIAALPASVGARSSRGSSSAPTVRGMRPKSLG